MKWEADVINEKVRLIDCAAQECAPPFGDKEDCEMYENGYCTALSDDTVRQPCIEGPCGAKMV